MKVLNDIKRTLVSQLLTLVAPHMRTYEKFQTGPVPVWAQTSADGFTQQISLQDGYLPPVMMLSEKGVYCNAYGNAVLKPWDKVCVEDVARLLDVAKSWVAQQEAAQQAALKSYWAVTQLSPLDRHRTIFEARIKETAQNGSFQELKVLLKTAGTNVATLFPPVAAKNSSDLKEFLKGLELQCDEFSVKS